MVEGANIDVEQNEILNLRIARLAAELAQKQSALNSLRLKRVLAILGALAAAVSPFIANQIAIANNMFLLPIGWVIAALCAAAGAFFAIRGAAQLTRVIVPARLEVAEETQRKEGYISQARAQIAPLRETYQWNMLDPLVEQTITGLTLDKYVPLSRQLDLQNNYGLLTPVGPDSSVVAAQSGSFNGNPFVLLQTLNFAMGVKQYTGSMVISWVETERYTDSNGRSQTRLVTRTQTLIAHVSKPFPEYFPDAFLFLGTEAAPNLAFSRAPSKLSALEGKTAQRRVERTVKKLEKQARKTQEGNNFTVTANQDFDALFHAVDRNDEVQFRVLFTPAAQQQMVELLRDKQSGYGDNFEFYKDGKIITVRAHHLVNSDIVGVPLPASESNEQWNLAAQRTGFVQRSGAQFRDQFYAFAPIFAIPLLHEPRESPEPEEIKQPSIWEAEAAANHRRADFSHPQSVTQEILKAIPNATDPRRFQIRTDGFRGVERIDYVPTLGGDGRIHAVPVPWVEYIPVSQARTMLAWDAAEQPPEVAKGSDGVFRRGLITAV
jgi:hypothetical protein